MFKQVKSAISILSKFDPSIIKVAGSVVKRIGKNEVAQMIRSEEGRKEFVGRVFFQLKPETKASMIRNAGSEESAKLYVEEKISAYFENPKNAKHFDKKLKKQAKAA